MLLLGRLTVCHSWACPLNPPVTRLLHPSASALMPGSRWRGEPSLLELLCLKWGHLSQQDLIPETTVLRIKDSIIPSYEAPGAAQWQKKLIHTLHISLVPGKANVILFFLQIRKSETQRGEITCPVPQLVNSQSNTYWITSICVTWTVYCALLLNDPRNKPQR